MKFPIRLPTGVSFRQPKGRAPLLVEEISLWREGWYNYGQRRLKKWGTKFEKQKDLVVDILMARRGTYQRPFLHLSLGMLVLVGVTSAPILANAYPGALPSSVTTLPPASAVATSLDLSNLGIQTEKSERPRDQVITYTVVKGDTLAKVAEKFGVSVDTVKWANDTKGDSLNIGDQLQIPPVTGVVHKVKDGETVQSIAKRYKTDAQKIVNYPFNDYSDLDTFALNVGQILVVPDGVPPAAAPIAFVPTTYVAMNGTGRLLWPTNGLITQYPIWYHLAFDIANPSGPGVMAADTGTVVLVEYLRYGYGQHIIIDHGNSFSTLYGHLQEIYVKAGDNVSRGQVIGRMGSTGRSTGTHLHFETRIGGVAVNPAAYFK